MGLATMKGTTEVIEKEANMEGSQTSAVRKEEDIKLNKVIHIRNIPGDTTEAEVIHMGIPFGGVEN